MPVFVGEAEAMIAFARRVWGIQPKAKKSKPKAKKVKKPSYPKGMP